MNRYQQMRQQVTQVLEALMREGALPNDLVLDAVTVEPPRDAAHGDMATNAAMVIAKPAGKKPREVAELLVAKIQDFAEVETAEIAGPGFINLRVKPELWQSVVRDVLEHGVGYGNVDIGEGQAVNIEYVSANPTGPMHIGHARGAVVGDVLALLMMKAGYNVTKEYYINDAGAQVEALTRSAYLRYKEALGEEIGEIPEGLYPGAYLKRVGEGFALAHDHKYNHVDEEKWFPVVREFVIDAMMTEIREELQFLGIEHDVFSSEQALIDGEKLEAVMGVLEKKNLLYQGVLEPPKGKTPEDWEPRKQLLFRSTSYGDDIDRPLKKSDGSHTYFSSDIAYHYDKLDRGFRRMILVLGADHGGYVKRMQAAVGAMSEGIARLDVVLYQLVNFLEGGEPMKMSKRAGTYLTVRDVIDAVGKDVVRFIMLTRKNDAVLDFDLQKVTEQSKDNPVFYVQYAHARSCSVLRRAAQELPDAVKDGYDVTAETLALLASEDEIALIKQIAQWPRVVEAAAQQLEPHRIAFYLQELAAEFHALWNKGNDNPDLRFIIEDNAALTKARLSLVKALATVIASGLHVMGVEPVHEM